MSRGWCEHDNCLDCAREKAAEEAAAPIRNGRLQTVYSRICLALCAVAMVLGLLDFYRVGMWVLALAVIAAFRVTHLRGWHAGRKAALASEVEPRS